MSATALQPTWSPVSDPQIGRLLSLARIHLGVEVTWVSVFTADQQVIVAADGETTAMNVALGAGSDLAGSYCTRVLAGTLPPVVTDARVHPVTRDLTVTGQMNIGSYIGAPWHGPDGTVAGMLCCLSRHADPNLSEQDVRYVRLLADLISDHLAAPAAQRRRHSLALETRVRTVLDTAAVRTVFQPVVRLADGVAVAFEALSRFDPALFATPDKAFAAATACGLGTALEVLAIRSAFAHLDRLPAGARLNVNLSPAALLTGQAQGVLLQHAGHGIGVEVTEHVPVTDYGPLTETTRMLREHGVQVLVDDAGAGFASLSHILKLRPDLIKLDISLVRGIDEDPVRRALAQSLNLFAAETGAHLIAEGIETRPERDTLHGLGVAYGQGFLYGKPGPLPAAAQGRR